MKYLFLALAFFLPTQLGLHFWPEWAFINGIRIDYFAPTIYFTDILIVMLAASSIYKKSRFRFATGMTLGLVLFALINIYFSVLPQLSIYKWLKFFEFLSLGIWIKNNYQKDWTGDFIKVLSLSIAFQTILALLQFANQGSIGGPLYWFGERTFTAATPGIAQAFLFGKLILRSYGTLPHPNVLAGYVLITSALIYLLNRKTLFYLLPFLLVTTTLTISRLPAIILIISPIMFLVAKGSSKISTKSKLVRASLAILILGAVFFVFGSGLMAGQSWSIREKLNHVSLEIIKNNFYVGSGLGTFILAAKNLTGNLFLNSQPLAFFQPVHNIYLLVLSETGILGFLFFLKLFFKKSLLIFIILLLGLFDHYFLTVQQGQLLTTLVLGLAWGKKV